MLKKWALSRPLRRTLNLPKFKMITSEVKKNTHYIFKSKNFYRWIFSIVWILVSDTELSASVDVRVSPPLRCQFLELGSESKKYQQHHQVSLKILQRIVWWIENLCCVHQLHLLPQILSLVFVTLFSVVNPCANSACHPSAICLITQAALDDVPNSKFNIKASCHCPDDFKAANHPMNPRVSNNIKSH